MRKLLGYFLFFWPLAVILYFFFMLLYETGAIWVFLCTIAAIASVMGGAALIIGEWPPKWK